MSTPASLPYAFVAKIVAADGQHDALADLLAGAVALANEEGGTIVWFAVRTHADTFWIFDAFPDEAAIAVDTHVFRVSHRLGLANAATPDKVEAQLFKVVPEDFLPKAHHWLILHGRYTCTARKPDCLGCLISDLCPSRAGLVATGEAKA